MFAKQFQLPTCESLFYVSFLHLGPFYELMEKLNTVYEPKLKVTNQSKI